MSGDTNPLSQADVEDLLTPNPPSWGEDGYPAGFTLFGLKVIVRPDMDPSPGWMIVQDDTDRGPTP